MREEHRADDTAVIHQLAERAQITRALRASMSTRAATLVRDIRASGNPGLMDRFLAEYGLSSQEGVALMTLAEALLRVPDTSTIDALIEDKITGSQWAAHAGQSHSALINFSTRALMITDSILQADTDVGVNIRQVAKRLGEPVIRLAVKRAMKELGQQFVLGETVEEALQQGLSLHSQGYRYSYDMLGEAAVTANDALQYFHAYKSAIERLAQSSHSADCRENPGISIKLSALHPRYEVAQSARVMDELVGRVRTLAVLAAKANMGFNIDAEEADRLELSLDVIEAVALTSELSAWTGFGIVVQAYGKRAATVIDWFYALSKQLNRQFMVRLVKGAYWDTEIKLAQVSGVGGFPVYQSKHSTDMSFLCCARQLMNYSHNLYPQFATHNAHTVCAILELAKHAALDDSADYEFQRLHGMGEELHDIVLKQQGTRCRIYAPVGAHEDLLAYLVRRLLENGANSSFVNQLNDPSIEPEQLAADPFEALHHVAQSDKSSLIRDASEIYSPERINSKGWDLADPLHLHDVVGAREEFLEYIWQVAPMLADNQIRCSEGVEQVVCNPAFPGQVVGGAHLATQVHIESALNEATPWQDTDCVERARILVAASTLLEERYGEIFTLLARESGKSTQDAIAEMREAVDFLRYYAAQSLQQGDSVLPWGTVVCISPWNFPLAIFLGQVSAALAAGNAVIAKPADPTPLIAALAVSVLHEAGVPPAALQLLPGSGDKVGVALTSDPRVDAVCFTGSTRVARLINQSMAAHLAPEAPLIAETGGLNAMIVDSTALPEQAVRDIVVSSFQSAGQRCSALRILCIQEDILDPLMRMLRGAMHELCIDDPLKFSTDVGPAISDTAAQDIQAYVQQADNEGLLVDQLPVGAQLQGYFVAPSIIRINNIADVEREIFGPVLHVLAFRADELDALIEQINHTGYGLTFGLQTRISERIETVSHAINAGNVYVNRNQIGAVVGSQPFGGEGLSGTGPKAGGPGYLPAFYRHASTTPAQQRPMPPDMASPDMVSPDMVSEAQVQELIDAQVVSTSVLQRTNLPGPTGEINELSVYPRGVVLCLGYCPATAKQQQRIALECGCQPVVITPGASGEQTLDGKLNPDYLSGLSGFSAVACCSSDENQLRRLRMALAARVGPIIPLISSLESMARACVLERHVCIDTTAAGGNTELIAGYGYE